MRCQKVDNLGLSINAFHRALMRFQELMLSKLLEEQTSSVSKLMFSDIP